VGHDYQPDGRQLKFQTTVRDQQKSNIHIQVNTTKEEFVLFRNQRDKTLKDPKLLIPSLKFNLVAGLLRR
jgi:hypothetical protein